MARERRLLVANPEGFAGNRGTQKNETHPSAVVDAPWELDSGPVTRYGMARTLPSRLARSANASPSNTSASTSWLLSPDVICQAKGLLMEGVKTTPETAFDILWSST